MTVVGIYNTEMPLRKEGSLLCLDSVAFVCLGAVVSLLDFKVTF